MSNYARNTIVSLLIALVSGMAVAQEPVPIDGGPDRIPDLRLSDLVATDPNSGKMKVEIPMLEASGEASGGEAASHSGTGNGRKGRVFDAVSPSKPGTAKSRSFAGKVFIPSGGSTGKQALIVARSGNAPGGFGAYPTFAPDMHASDEQMRIGNKQVVPLIDLLAPSEAWAGKKPSPVSGDFVEIPVEFLCLEPEKDDPEKGGEWIFSDDPEKIFPDLSRTRKILFQLMSGVEKVDREIERLAGHVRIEGDAGQEEIQYKGPPLSEAWAHLLRTTDWKKVSDSSVSGKLNWSVVVQYAFWTQTHGYDLHELNRRLRSQRLAYAQIREASIRWSVQYLLKQAETEKGMPFRTRETQ